MVDVRYSPSGPVIATLGTGCRLRLAELTSIMSGTTLIPFPAAVMCANGFGGSPPLRVALAKPKEDRNYRVSLAVDVANESTNTLGAVTLYLDSSVDGGSVWTNRAKNTHYVGAALVGNEARMCQVNLDQTLGSALGVVDDATADVQFRVRAEAALGASLNVSALAQSPGGSPVTGLNGTIHFELEECLA